VVAFITSSGTLDKKTSKVREYLASQAELVGAIRLPNTTFAEAGTGVTADIIFLKKREAPLPVHEAKPDWCYTAENDDGLRINSYFVQNPNMILGTMRKTGYFDRLTCDPKPDVPLKVQLRDAVASLNAKITVTRRQEALRARQEQIAPWGKDYSYHEKDGKIYYRQGEHMDAVKGNAAEITRIRQLIEIRTLTRALLDKQKTNVPDEALTAMREKLNELYDAYVKENGALSSAENKKRFGRDADYPILQSLENFNAQTQAYEKADIFYKRTVASIAEIKSVETLDEAFQVSLDRRGKPDIPYMAALLQATEPDMEMKELMQKVERDLLASGLVFLDPEKAIPDVPFSGITDRSEYLSGNVRRKLAFAEEKARDNPRFQANVDALTAVIPEDIHAEEITVRMGCTWIDAEDYTDFLHTLSGRDSWDIRCEVTYTPQTGEFDIMKAGSRKDLNVNEGTTYGTDSLTMYEIALKMLNQTRIVVNKTVPSPKDPSKTITRVDPEKTRLAQEKAKQIEAKFKEWIFADPKRKEKYEKRYNELFNALVGRQYDGSRLTFNGMATDFELRPHQRNCIARAVYGGNTLAAHVVGAGKSAVFITAVMKKKELGLINKACIVVPKALTEQTALEWRRIFPDARLLTVGEMDLSTQDKRDVFTARIATGNYDAVIVSREQFDKMAMSPAYQRDYIQREIDALEDMLIAQKMAGATKNTPSVKKIEAAKKRLEKRLENALNPKKMSTRSKDGVLEFEQLGFDYLVVDEAHAYKNGAKRCA
jgi:N12 class adenine-specific DNA methylase